MNKKRIALIFALAISFIQATRLVFRNNVTGAPYSHEFESTDTGVLAHHVTDVIANPMAFFDLTEDKFAWLVLGTNKLKTENDVNIFLRPLLADAPEVVDINVLITDCHFVAKNEPLHLVFVSLRDPDFEITTWSRGTPGVYEGRYPISELPTFSSDDTIMIYTPSRTGVYGARGRQSGMTYHNVFRPGKEDKQHDVLHYFHENSEKLPGLLRRIRDIAPGQSWDAVIECLIAHAEGEIEEARTLLAALPEEAQKGLVELQLIPPL